MEDVRVAIYNGLRRVHATACSVRSVVGIVGRSSHQQDGQIGKDRELGANAKNRSPNLMDAIALLHLIWTGSKDQSKASRICTLPG